MFVFKCKIYLLAILAIFLNFNISFGSEIRYNAGLGFGIAHFQFNSNREDTDFHSNMNRPEVLRTSYKYVGNHPQKNLNFEAGANKSFEEKRMLERNLFMAAHFMVGIGKVNAAKGLLNPNSNYMSTGSASIYYSLSSKFGLENSFSKLYGVLGLTYVNASLPFDILPLGANSPVGDLGTCTALKPGSPLLEKLAQIPSLAQAAALLNNYCGNISVKDASYGAFFINIGAGTEFQLTQRMNLFWEYTYLMQINKGKVHNVNYSYKGNPGVFKGKIVTTNTQFVKFGARYYF